ncbi:MAG: hypothetical protein AABW46_03900, partial [Nanoarchaeota archaeon]
NNRRLRLYLETKGNLSSNEGELSRYASAAAKTLVEQSESHKKNGNDPSHKKRAIEAAIRLRAIGDYARDKRISSLKYIDNVDPNEIPIFDDSRTKTPYFSLSKIKDLYEITKGAIKGLVPKERLAQEFIQDYVPRLEETTKKQEVSTGINEFVPTELERLLGKEIGYVRRNIELLTDKVANVFSAAIDNMANIDPQKAIKYAKRASKKLPGLLQYKTFQEAWSNAEIKKNSMSRWDRFWDYRFI